MPNFAVFAPEFQIAATWNSAASLRRIASITPASDVLPFAPPAGYAFFNPGTLIIRADGLSYVAGYPSTIWRFSYMTRLQYAYLIATYSSGGNSYAGQVTVRTIKQDKTYANYNAIMRIPFLPELQHKRAKIYDVDIRFSRLVAI